MEALAQHAQLIGLAAVLAVCLGVLAWLWDGRRGEASIVRRRVWCERFGRYAEVDFAERMATGWKERTVVRCPIRRKRAMCGEVCALQPELRDHPSAPVVTVTPGVPSASAGRR